MSHITHGLSNDPLYSLWRGMRERCYNPNRPSYKWYGALGIKVCERWEKFENFYVDMHPRPSGTQLDRIDGRLGYSKDNCRWATPLQNITNKDATVFVEYEGKTVSLREAERLSGISARTIRRRMKAGQPLFGCRGFVVSNHQGELMSSKPKQSSAVDAAERQWRKAPADSKPTYQALAKKHDVAESTIWRAMKRWAAQPEAK